MARCLLLRRWQGSVTVFLTYLLVFILAVVFSLLEVSRVWGLEQRTEVDAVMTGNSLLSEYDVELWEKYGLLFLDGSYGQAGFQWKCVEQQGLSFSTENLDVHGGDTGKVQLQTWNLFGLKPVNVTITGYGLATDQDGRAFYKEAVTAMEEQCTEEILCQLYDMITQKKDSVLPEVDVQETDREIVLSENPIQVAENMKASNILDFVVNGTELSDKRIDLSNGLQKRQLDTGTYSYAETGADWKEKLLFRQYLEAYFPCYLDVDGSHALDYELEYLIAGKDSDRENLRGVIQRLLVMREVTNLAYLKSDVEKQELILAAAAALAAATLTPELIPVYKQGIMAAWAYVESVSDVKLLLDGQKVKLIKTAEQWHSDLTSMGTTAVSVQQTQGLSYQQYLQILLWTCMDSRLCYRAMDLIEANLGCNMNRQIYRMEGDIFYQGKPLFSALLAIGKGSLDQYEFSQSFDVNYLRE
ncbi:MAG: hypothetical protein IJ471_01850 [Eubacterium sp.]|nr:hypothetical protein [Eubacterium sp.]